MRIFGVIVNWFFEKILFFGSALGRGKERCFLALIQCSMDISTRRENQYVNRKKHNIYLIAVYIDTVGIGMSG
jgi:hypothetical protein